MSVAFISRTAGSQAADDEISVAVTVPALTELMIAMFTHNIPPDPEPVISATYAGLPLAVIDYEGFGEFNTQFRYLLNPPVGTANAIVTLNPVWIGFGNMILSVCLFRGIRLAAPFAHGTGFGTMIGGKGLDESDYSLVASSAPLPARLLTFAAAIFKAGGAPSLTFGAEQTDVGQTLLGEARQAVGIRETTGGPTVLSGIFGAASDWHVGVVEIMPDTLSVTSRIMTGDHSDTTSVASDQQVSVLHADLASARSLPAELTSAVRLADQTTKEALEAP